MSITDQLHKDIYEFQLNFDKLYLDCIPRLLDETGMFLAFLIFLTALDVLAGAYSAEKLPGLRFRSFAGLFLPLELRPFGPDLWKARNLMVHSFNPGNFGLVSGQSRLHLSKNHSVTMLNAQDLYAALVVSARGYFTALQNNSELQEIFAKRISDDDGGAPESYTVNEYY
ncbi:MAG: hypothetical protein JWM78_3457 [Verrucomicrobiaceae bacterium]|nr:hypothetical protein [Verrucomicrobiaceae bacterium]